MTRRNGLLQHFPQPLLDELVAGRWLPMVGAGLSRNAVIPSGAQMPLWDQLGRSLGDDVPEHFYVGAIDAISAYEQEFGRRELVNRLNRELFTSEAVPGSAHTAFCRLRFDRVVTTNFDSLLEDGYDRSGERRTVIVDEQQLPIPAPDGATVLLKLHGDLRRPDRLVATEDDYDGFHIRQPVLLTYLASLLIERTLVLIGYSLDDVDLRQVMAALRDRLGGMLPSPYAITVGESPASVARFVRRGVKVINLPGRREHYGRVLESAFLELSGYWQHNVLERGVKFIEEPISERVILRAGGARSNLCFFGLPAELLPIYQREVFPFVLEAGMVPVTAHDVVAQTGNSLAVTRALIESSRAAVIDVGKGTGSTELNAAAGYLGADNVLVVTTEEQKRWMMSWPSLTFIFRPPSGQTNLAEQIGRWIESRAEPYTEVDSEATRLWEKKEYRAALVASVTELERILSDWPVDLKWSRARFGAVRPPLRELVRAPDLPVTERWRRDVLLVLRLRNEAVHRAAPISRAQAEGAMRLVDELKRRLRGERF